VKIKEINTPDINLQVKSAKLEWEEEKVVRDGEVPHTYRSRLEEYLTQLESSNYAVFSAMESQIRDDLIVVYVDVLLLGSTRRHVVLDNNKVRPATYKENWRVMAAQVVK